MTRRRSVATHTSLEQPDTQTIRRPGRLTQPVMLAVDLTAAVTAPQIAFPGILVFLPLPVPGATTGTPGTFHGLPDEGGVPVLRQPQRFPFLGNPTGEHGKRDAVLGGIVDLLSEPQIPLIAVFDKGRSDP